MKDARQKLWDLILSWRGRVAELERKQDMYDPDTTRLDTLRECLEEAERAYKHEPREWEGRDLSGRHDDRYRGIGGGSGY